MSMFFFTFRAGTQARLGAEILRKAGISARVAKTPSQLSRYGCGYGLWIPEGQAQTASGLLKSGGRSYIKCYRMINGTFREVRL